MAPDYLIVGRQLTVVLKYNTVCFVVVTIELYKWNIWFNSWIGYRCTPRHCVPRIVFQTLGLSTFDRSCLTQAGCLDSFCNRWPKSIMRLNRRTFVFKDWALRTWSVSAWDRPCLACLGRSRCCLEVACEVFSTSVMTRGYCEYLQILHFSRNLL